MKARRCGNIRIVLLTLLNVGLLTFASASEGEARRSNKQCTYEMGSGGHCQEFCWTTCYGCSCGGTCADNCE